MNDRQPSSGEITIVISDWAKISACMHRLWGQDGCTNHLGDRRDLKADALIGSLRHEYEETQHKTHTLPMPVGATTRTSAPTQSTPIFPSSVLHLEELITYHLLPRRKSLSVSPCIRYIRRPENMHNNRKIVCLQRNTLCKHPGSRQ